MALLQLAINNTVDDYISGNTLAPQCANARDSIMYWFIDRDDGRATKDDVHYVYKNAVPTRTIISSHMVYKEYNNVQPSMYPIL